MNASQRTQNIVLPKGVSPHFGSNIKAHQSDLFRLKRCDGMKFDNESDRFNFLKNQGIDSDEHIKTATEGALIFIEKYINT